MFLLTWTIYWNHLGPSILRLEEVCRRHNYTVSLSNFDAILLEFDFIGCVPLFVIHIIVFIVCVPINPAKCASFDPFATPTLATMNHEINEFDRKHPELKGTTPAIEKTSLNQFIVDFRKNFLNPLYSTIRSEFRESAEKEAAATGDW